MSFVSFVGLLVDFGFNVPPTVKVIWRQDLGLLSHPTDWRSLGSNLRPLVFKESDINTAV